MLADDERLKRQGKADQAAGKLEQAVEEVKKRTEEVIDDVKDALS